MTVQTEFFSLIPYFTGLDSTDLISIAKSFHERSVDKGDMVLFEDELVETLYFVASGAVKLFKTSSEGKEQIISLARPGDSFNDVPVFDGASSPVSAQAITPVTLYAASKGDLEAIFKRHPVVVLNVIEVLAGQVRHLMTMIEGFSFRHVINRVARILLEHAENGGDSPPRLTQQEMAAMAGTAREVVGRSLKAMEDEGIIHMERHRIVVTNKQALENMAEVTP